jgi:hypothetical protein
MTSLPTPLVRFRAELENAIAEDLRPHEGPGRLAVRVVAAAGVCAALAAGALTALPGDPAGQLLEPASAADRAAAVLAASPGSIVYVETVVQQRHSDGSTTSWRAEIWQETARPYDVRQLVTDADGKTVETATVDGEQQLYDPRTDTIHVGGSGGTPPPATPAPAAAEPFRAQVLQLLRDGKLTPIGRSSVDGRSAISFAWDDAHTRYEYTVEAGTYVPIRWRFTPAGGGETTVTFESYEILRPEDAPLALRAHHPSAVVRGRP